MSRKPTLFNWLKPVCIVIVACISFFENSCKKQESQTGNSNNNFVDINSLRPEIKIQPTEVFDWIAANVPDAHKGTLKLNQIQQRFIDNHHVIKIPIQDDAALFFTKDSAKLKVYAYKWDDRDAGTKWYTGHIVSFSFQDFSVRALQYYEGKKIKDKTLKVGSAVFSSKINVQGALDDRNSMKGLLNTSGEERVRTMSLLGDIWCLLTGGTLYSNKGSTGNGCDYGNGGNNWVGDVMQFLSDIFGGTNSDSGSYGNTASSPVGVWYGTGAYTGPSPSQGGGGGNGTTPASQPYNGGPVWVSQWVDTTNPANCTTTDENGNMMYVPGGCSTGYWQSVQILEYPRDDSNGSSEMDPENVRGVEGPQSVLPSDNATYSEYQQNNPWPTVRDVMGWYNFVPFDGRQCYELAKQQIGKIGYTTTGWDANSNLIFKMYNEHSSPTVDLSTTKKAITYINGALASGIPVLTGIDYYAGDPGNADHTTDHFVVIVGAGTDSNGKFYRFYDPGTASISRGTNPDNKLYYNESTGLISGHTHVGKLAPFVYKVTHVRKSIHL